MGEMREREMRDGRNERDREIRRWLAGSNGPEKITLGRRLFVETRLSEQRILIYQNARLQNRGGLAAWSED